LNPVNNNGYSKNQIQRTLKKLELPYSEQEIEKIKENLKEKVDNFKTRRGQIYKNFLFLILFQVLHFTLRVFLCFPIFGFNNKREGITGKYSGYLKN